jgi:hypothetical protein
LACCKSQFVFRLVLPRLPLRQPPLGFVALLFGASAAKIPAGQPGAGSTLAEMRGDLPGNYFPWILRYPQQDAVIIVLRNVYGSTAGFEQNLQAILFDLEPRFPSRSPKDLAAQLWLVPAAWISSHSTVSLVLLFFIAATVVLATCPKLRN